MLHGFGCYAFGWILVPSGWRKVDFDGNVEVSVDLLTRFNWI